MLKAVVVTISPAALMTLLFLQRFFLLLSPIYSLYKRHLFESTSHEMVYGNGNGSKRCPRTYRVNLYKFNTNLQREVFL
jgi:hypothetical protein